MSSKAPKKKEKKTTVENLPGMVSSIAALITALAGIITVIVNAPKIFPQAELTPTVVVITATIQPTATNLVTAPMFEPSTTPTLQPTEPSAPRMYNFQACLSQCNGNNNAALFPEKTTRVFVQWNYEGIPVGADYIRTWTMNGQEWARYTCPWDGPAAGVETVKLTEPQGLHSGAWEMTIVVNGVVLLKEQIVVQGMWNAWAPVGQVNGRRGTN